MAKKKKTKKSGNGSSSGSGSKSSQAKGKEDKTIKNPLLERQTQFLKSLPSKVRDNFFSSKYIDPETRADIWSRQAELGEDLVNKHSWSTPDERCLKILKHFSPIVEIGCGANAYWARMMHKNGIDVMAFDSQLDLGGQIDGSHGKKTNDMKGKKKKRKRDDDSTIKRFEDGFQIVKGGPDVLATKNTKKRSLFLCYPDEDIMVDDDDNSTEIESMGSACLAHFQGDTVVHVGELYGDTPSMDQAPWGRSSGAQFQQRLAAEYHCILKAKLTNWLHVRDTISVWKRSELCSIVFAGEDDDDSDEEVEYKHIPVDQILPTDTAAPCAKHLLE